MSNEIELDFASYVDLMAKVLGFSLNADVRDGVIENLARTATIAQLVLEFPLADDIEAGPTFQP